MSLSDPIANFLTVLRNGQLRMLKVVKVPKSFIVQSILNILVSEGYIINFDEKVTKNNLKFFEICLKYNLQTPVIREVVRVSKPGKRVYYSAKMMPKFYNGLGIYVVSTSKGIISDSNARKLIVGGELLCGFF